MNKLFIDQYGNRIHARTRKELVQKASVSGRVSKMYQDKLDGTTVAVGYVIGQHWFTCYVPFEKPV